ncbi:MAG: hypothetical protein AAB667_01000 [Patescibacteria group bacterium]
MDDPNQRPSSSLPFGAPLSPGNQPQPRSQFANPNTPPPPQPMGNVDLKFAPSAALVPKPEPIQPVSPAPAQSQQPTSYKTSIRTMSEDIANLKTGQKPAGSEIEKVITSPAPAPRQFIQESAPKPAIPTAPRLVAPSMPVPSTGFPSPKPIPAPIPRITIPPIKAAEESRPQMPNITPPFAPPVVKQQQVKEQAPFISVPKGPTGVSKWRLFALLGIGLILVAAIVWLLNRGTGEIATTPTPSTTRTPTPTPAITLQTMFGELSSASINLSATTNLPEEFKNQVNQISIIPDEIKRLTITSVSKGGGELNLTDLMDRLQITYPIELKQTLGNEYIILVYGQREMFNSSGAVSQATTGQPRLIFVTQVIDTAKATEITRIWETTMTDQLVSLFGYIKSKVASQTFLDNSYAGSPIRYKNYSFPDRTTDYSIVSAINNRAYFVLANSREGIYKVIDILR